MKKKKEKHQKLVLHNLIEKDKETGLYAVICLELDVATQGETIKEAEANIKEAVELYLESVYENGDEKDFIPRPAPRNLWLKFFKKQEEELREKIKKHPEKYLQFETAVLLTG